MPRDFDACELLAHVGRPCGPKTKFRLSTLLDADDALHVDFLLSLQRAAVHELHEAYDAARDPHLVLCAFDTFEWTAKMGQMRFFWRVTQDATDNQFKCLTPGFTVASRDAPTKLGARHVATMVRPPMFVPAWRHPVVHVVGALPIRGRTVTSHGAGGLVGAQRKIKGHQITHMPDVQALGWFPGARYIQLLHNAASFLSAPNVTQRIVQEQAAGAEAACNGTKYSAFSCKRDKVDHLRQFADHAGRAGRRRDRPPPS